MQFSQDEEKALKNWTLLALRNILNSRLYNEFKVENWNRVSLFITNFFLFCFILCDSLF